MVQTPAQLSWALWQHLLPGWGWTNGEKLLPAFPYTGWRVLPDTRADWDELQPNQTSSSGHLFKGLQLPLPVTQTLKIKQRELIYTWGIDSKWRRGEEKDTSTIF